MKAKEQLMQEIQFIPEPLVQEVLNFLLFAKNRKVIEPKTDGDRETYQPIGEYAHELMQDTTPDNLALLHPDSARNRDRDLNTNFWDSEPLSNQSIPVITDIRVLTTSFWEDEPVDEFDQFIASSRQADR